MPNYGIVAEQRLRAYGVNRWTSSFNTNHFDDQYRDPHQSHRRLILQYSDMTDTTNLIRIVQVGQLNEIYNLAAQSCGCATLFL